MNKSIRKVVLAAAIIAVAGYGVYENQSKETLSDVMLENVEALAIPEQPNLNDCVPMTGCVCLALHPTDPEKDDFKYDYAWP